MPESIIPAVLLRALSEYKFVDHPLWRMADGKDHVRVELTSHKNLPTLPIYKRRAESKRQPAPSAGEWPRQPTAARRPPTTTRSTPTVRRESTAPEKKTLPPALQTLEINTPDTITVIRPPKTVQFTPSPYIRNQLHRLLLQRLHVPRDREQSRRSTWPNSRYSISRQHRERISSTREIRPPGRPRHHLQGHH